MWRVTGILRWIARIMGLTLAVIVGLFAVCAGFDPRQLNFTTCVMTMAFFGAVVGMLVLWRWERIGGLIVLVGMASFYAINFVAARKWPGGWVLPLCFLPGILALLSCAMTRTAKTT